MEYKDYYKIMGIDKKATAKELKQAYRKLAKKYHPDVNPGNKEAEARFKEINEAYEVLGNEEKRGKYDELGANWKHYEQWQKAGGKAGGQPFDWSQYGFTPGSGKAGGYQTRNMTEEELRGMFGDSSPFSSFFYTFFGGGGPDPITRQRSRTASRSRKGQDFEQSIEVSLEEAFHGTERVLQMEDERGGVRRLQAKIPAGVQDGSRVRLAEQGGPGMGGGQAGNLYLIVHVTPHHLFERKGDDLYLKLDIPLTTAILGGEVSVPTLSGGVMLKVPRETQNGRVFRLRGRGMPKLGKPQQHADLFAEAKVILPEQLSEQERRLFEEFARLRSAGGR